jgi:hypothetical protein
MQVPMTKLTSMSVIVCTKMHKHSIHTVCSALSLQASKVHQVDDFIKVNFLKFFQQPV